MCDMVDISLAGKIFTRLRLVKIRSLARKIFHLIPCHVICSNWRDWLKSVSYMGS